jgi:GntR family transcriptional regulator
MFELDLRSRLPVYEQLVEKFKELIINEILKSDEKLPSVRALAADLTINPNTIQKAYKELERQEYIYSVKGKGSFVAPVKKNINKENIEKLKQELKKILSEVMFLGMKKEEIYNIVTEIESTIKGGSSGDSNRKSK